MSNPDGRGVFVTGASSGIGEASAIELAQRGFRVFAGYRKPDDGERLGGMDGVEPVRIDVTDQEQIAEAAGQVSDSLGDDGSLFGLVNNAGIPVPGAVEALALDELRRQLEVNLVGAVAVSQALLPQIRAARGRILNVTSVGGKVATPYMSAYHASKFALEAVNDSLRREMIPHGVDVIAIEPGSVATKIWDAGRRHAEKAAEELSEEVRRTYGAELLVAQKTAAVTGERGIDPAEAARTIARAMMASRPRARYVVGRDARAMIAAQAILPTRVFDRMMRRAMGF